jgi:ATP-dependent Clp protease protease subunit
VTEKNDEKTKKSPERKKLKLRVERADARKAELELERAEIGLELDRLRAAELKHGFALKAVGDQAKGIFSLEKQVGRSAVDLATEIRQFGRAFPGHPITLNLFSPGGSVFDGLVLYDTLRTLADQGHLVTTVARGMAASMGSLLFLAGDNRLIGSQAMVMFHGMAASTGGSIYSMEEDLEFYKKIEERMDQIVFERTKVTPKMLAKKTKKKDWWLDADECLKLKVATARG